MVKKSGPIVGQEFFRTAKFARFEGDWFAVDRASRIAFFIGGAHGAIPLGADVERTTEAIDALSRAAEARIAGAGYRAAAALTNECVFDPPSTSEGGPLHEKPIDGYPHLVVGEDPPRLREVLSSFAELREVLVTRGAGIVAYGLSLGEWSVVHAEDALCLGCRATSHLDDPQPRAPEILARGGLYVFAHDASDERAPYVRVASPSMPADLGDIEPIVAALAQRVPFPTTFAEHERLAPSQYVACR